MAGADAFDPRAAARLRRRRAAWSLLAFVGVQVVLAIAVRSLGAVAAARRVTSRRLNPLTLRVAGRRGNLARVEHVGRRSGRAYATPVLVQPVREGFAIPLPYGTGVDWLRNVRAAGGAWLQVDRGHYAVSDPRVVTTPELAAQLTPRHRWMARQYGIRSWLVVRVAPAAGGVAAARSAGGAPAGPEGSPGEPGRPEPGASP